MVLVHGTIAWSIERGETGSVFAEFVTPEVAVRSSLADPEFVHERQEVEFAEGGEERADAGAFVGWEGGPRGGTGCGVG